MITDVVCPGIKTALDEKGQVIIHYLHIINEDNPNPKMLCKESKCKYAYRDEHLQDHWRSDFDLMKLPT